MTNAEEQSFLNSLQKHYYVLTSGDNVGAVAEEENSEPFADKMSGLGFEV